MSIVRQSRQHRAEASLPAPVHADLVRVARARGVTIGELCYAWTCDAARLADQGLGHLLPPVPTTRAARGAVGGYKQVKWLQSEPQAERWRALIEAAGSSVPVVLAAAAQAYAEADGDPLTMPWPPTMRRKVAA